MHDSPATINSHRPPAGRAACPCTCNDVIALIAREKQLSVLAFTHRSRCQLQTARARQLAMYLAHVVLGHSLTEIGDAFGRDRTTVSYACALIEDMRDDPAFDAEVLALENRLEARRSGSVDHAC